MNITEFLEARIAEDEAEAQAILDRSAPYAWENPMETGNCWPEEVRFLDRHSPARVIAECAAKRAIIAQAGEIEKMEMTVDEEWGGGLDWLGLGLLTTLAAVYKDHPDYREEWSSAT